MLWFLISSICLPAVARAPGPDPERALTEKQSRYGILQKSVSDLAGISASLVWFPRQNLHLTPDS